MTYFPAIRTPEARKLGASIRLHVLEERQGLLGVLPQRIVLGMKVDKALQVTPCGLELVRRLLLDTKVIESDLIVGLIGEDELEERRGRLLVAVVRHGVTHFEQHGGCQRS